MKTVILSLVLLASTLASASPRVVCEPLYSKTATSGATEEFRIGDLIVVTKNEAANSMKGFEIQTRLEQVCASDGGPCSNSYSLNVSIRKGQSQSVLNTEVDGTQDKNDRHSTSLIVGKESVHLNCDVE